MSALEQIQIPESAILWLVVASVLLFIIPILYAAVWKLRCGKKTRLKAFLIGGLGFFVTVRILELGVHMFCIVFDNPVSRAINGNIFLYVLYGTLMAGVFEEVGRHVILKKLVKKENTLANAVMYGIGHGGVEVWVITFLAMVSYLFIAITFRSLPLEEAITALNITEDTIEAALPSMMAIGSFGATSVFVTVLERVLCMFIHIGLTMIVYAGLKKDNRKYLYGAILLHMIMDTIPAIAQKMPLSPILTEGWVLIWTIIIMILAKKATQGVE
ncbi:MAG: YhfC family glutamic-type intramembrane protease [Lachnospiraceae bacterium]|nr:YhfC family glutamic-type intramembrane protease [Lachnospiraceae bacterium]